MKKIFLVIMFLIILSNSCFAISDNFKYIMSVSGISRYNNQGYEINEEIYYKYNQIVYGSPELAIDEPTQRWKNVKNGLWSKNGEKGEYRLLGYNYIGNIVNNHEFPNDVTPSSSPLTWNYLELDDAMDSWNSLSLFKYEDLRNYMKKTNLYRDNIEYELNCNTIGLNKTRVDNCSTMFSKGIVYTNRLDPYNKQWEATFVTQPIDKDIKLELEISASKDEYTITGLQDYIDIPITIEGKIVSSNPDFQEKYIKLIKNDIYIDNYKVDEYSSSQATFKKKVIVRVYRSDYPAGEGYDTEYNLDLKLRSTCFSNFPNDLPIYAKADNTVKLIVKQRFFMKQDMIVEESGYDEFLDEADYEYPDYIKDREEAGDKEDNEYKYDNINLYEIKKDNESKLYKKLNQTNSTSEKLSYGYIKAGNNLGIRIVTDKDVYKVEMSIEGDKSIKTFDDKTKMFEWDELVASGYDTRFNELSKYYEFYNKTKYEMDVNENGEENIFTFEYLIPYGTNQTLHSWNSIRDLEGNSFNIDTNKIFSRKDEPYNIKFEIYKLVTTINEEGEEETHTEIITKYIIFDVFECWNNLYNRDLETYHINSDNQYIKLEDWINNYE